MKRVTKALSVLLAVVMLMLVAEPAYAAISNVYSVRTLSAGTIVSGKQEVVNYDTNKRTHIIYKITTPKNGYITVTNYKGSDNTLYVYKTLADAKADKYTKRVDTTYKKTKSIPLAAGTYYIRPSYGAFKFKYTFKSCAIDTTNFCRAKATTLAKGKTVTVCAPKGYAYYRWYKINLTTKKVMNFTWKDLNTNSTKIPDSADLTLYNAAGDTFTLSHADGYVYTTTKSVPKGTYYLRVNAQYPESLHLSTVMWK